MDEHWSNEIDEHVHTMDEHFNTAGPTMSPIARPSLAIPIIFGYPDHLWLSRPSAAE
jgi:hypothetical protein